MTQFTVDPLITRLPLRWRPQPAPAPLGGAGTSYWYNARAAIWQGVKALGMVPGDRVLLPAYSCGSEIDSILKAGLGVDLYRASADLSPDLDHVESIRGERTRALYITHYLGFPQPLDRLAAYARERGLLLLEDNAHGLYSSDTQQRPLGTTGEAAFFSLMKTLPLPDAGTLILNRGVGEAPIVLPPSRAPELLPVAGKLRHGFELAAEARFPRPSDWLKRQIVDPGVAWLKARTTDASSGANGTASAETVHPVIQAVGLDMRRTHWRPSGVARFLFRHVQHGNVKAVRRRNYEILATGLAGDTRYQMLFPELPPGCCPLLFALRLDAPKRLQLWLAEAGFPGTYRLWSDFHPAMPAEHFPFESRLKQDVVAVPVHQDLDEETMHRMREALLSWPA